MLDSRFCPEIDSGTLGWRVGDNMNGADAGGFLCLTVSETEFYNNLVP